MASEPILLPGEYVDRHGHRPLTPDDASYLTPADIDAAREVAGKE